MNTPTVTTHAAYYDIRGVAFVYSFATRAEADRFAAESGRPTFVVTETLDRQDAIDQLLIDPCGRPTRRPHRERGLGDILALRAARVSS